MVDLRSTVGIKQHLTQEETSSRRNRSRSRRRSLKGQSASLRNQSCGEVATRERSESQKLSVSSSKSCYVSWNGQRTRFATNEKRVEESPGRRCIHVADPQQHTMKFGTAAVDFTSERGHKIPRVRGSNSRYDHCHLKEPARNRNLKSYSPNSHATTYGEFCPEENLARQLRGLAVESSRRSPPPPDMKLLSQMERHQRRRREELRFHDNHRTIESAEGSWNLWGLESSTRKNDSSHAPTCSRKSYMTSSDVNTVQGVEKLTYVWGFDKNLQPFRRLIVAPKGILVNPSSKRNQTNNQVAFYKKVNVFYFRRD